MTDKESNDYHLVFVSSCTQYENLFSFLATMKHLPVTSDLVRHLLPMVTSLHDSLSSSYTLLRAVQEPEPIGNTMTLTSAGGELRAKEGPDMESLYSCVHSLDLHLQSVLLV